MSGEELKYAFYGIGESLVMLNMLERKTVEGKVFQKSKGILNLFQYLLRLSDTPEVEILMGVPLRLDV